MYILMGFSFFLPSIASIKQLPAGIAELRLGIIKINNNKG